MTVSPMYFQLGISVSSFDFAYPLKDSVANCCFFPFGFSSVALKLLVRHRSVLVLMLTRSFLCLFNCYLNENNHKGQLETCLLFESRVSNAKEKKK